MSGRRIDDHHSWIGGAGKNMVMPEGAKTKNESSADSFGSLMHYEDTTEAIKAQQMSNTKHVHGHKQRPGYRY